MWTGQGTNGGVLNTLQCDASLTPYLHWILTTDGGSVQDDPAPVLHLGGSGSGNYTPSKDSGGAFHFDTPYFPLAGLTANADFTVVTTGNGKWVLTISHGCPGGGGATPDATLGTVPHDADHNDIMDEHLPLWTSGIHDKATLLVTGLAADAPWSGTLDVTLYRTSDDDPEVNPCTAAGKETVDSESDIPWNGIGNGTDAKDDLLTQGELGAGHYGFLASFVDDDASGDLTAPGVCEPFFIDKADTETTTEVHDAAHKEITNQGVPTGTAVHDKAIVTTDSTYSVEPTGNVTFKYFTNGTCAGELYTSEQVALAEDGTAESTPKTIDTPGHYSYLTSYDGDANYNGSEAECEPFWVYQLGKTMGFWGNKNGQARIGATINDNQISDADYAANTVDIGRGGVIDTKAESLKVLPNTLNACGKGTPLIFTGSGAPTASVDCTSATGINKNSLNTLASQTLALRYNIKLVGGYTGQTIGDLVCTAYATAGLSGSSTVNQAFTAAQSLIENSRPGGSTTQAQIGAMNSLLGCLNREA